MDTPSIQPQLQQQVIFHYAGFWKRFVAYILDQIIMSILAAIIIIPFLAMIGISLWSSDFDPSAGFIVTVISMYFTMILLLIIGEWLYYALMESMKGATLGKMAMGIIVIDLSGKRISFGRATSRYFAKIISSLTLGFGYIMAGFTLYGSPTSGTTFTRIGYTMAGFTLQKQALHDIISGCLVINK